MRFFLLAVAAALLALAAAPQTLANHPCSGLTTSPSVAIPSGVGTPPYLLATNKVTAGIALYQEANGIGGLHRSDIAHDDTCHGLFTGDSLVKFVAFL